MAKDQRDDRFPGHQLLVEAGYTGRPEQLGEQIEALRRRYGHNPADRTPAFPALTLITVKCEVEAEADNTAIDSRAPLSVPFWAPRALGTAWCRHRFEGVPLEVALGTGRPGRGERSPTEQHDSKAQKLGLARDIAYARELNGGQLEAAIQEAMDHGRLVTRGAGGRDHRGGSGRACSCRHGGQHAGVIGAPAREAFPGPVAGPGPDPSSFCCKRMARAPAGQFPAAPTPRT